MLRPSMSGGAARSRDVVRVEGGGRGSFDMGLLELVENS